MARATIFVRDVDESLKLYRDILRLKPMFDSRWSGKGINAIQNTKDLVLRACVLMCRRVDPGQHRHLPALGREREGARAAPDRRHAHRRLRGRVPHQRHLGHVQEDQGPGYVIVSPPVTLMQRPGYKVQPTEMMFRDRDGVLVNLLMAGVKE